MAAALPRAGARLLKPGTWLVGCAARMTTRFTPAFEGSTTGGSAVRKPSAASVVPSPAPPSPARLLQKLLRGEQAPPACSLPAHLRSRRTTAADVVQRQVQWAPPLHPARMGAEVAMASGAARTGINRQCCVSRGFRCVRPFSGRRRCY